jgi:hypothetical protein
MRKSKNNLIQGSLCPGRYSSWTFLTETQSVEKLPPLGNVLNCVHILQVTSDIRGRGMDGLQAEVRAAVFIARTCTQEWSTAINSKLGSTKSTPNHRFLHINVALCIFLFEKKYHDRNKFMFITKPCCNLIQLKCIAKCFIIFNQG